MEAQLTAVPVLASGEYGADVTRKDGSPIRWVDVYDGQATLRLTVGEEVDPAKLPSFGDLVDCTVTIRAREKGGIKLRVDSLKPSKVRSNGADSAAAVAA